MRDSPNLQQLIAQAKIYEVTEIQINQMENKNKCEPVNRITTSCKQQYNKNKSYNKDNTSKNTIRKCMNCGNNWHIEGRKACPALNIHCYHCTKKGHFANVCLKKQNKTTFQQNSIQEELPSSSNSKVPQSTNKVNFNKQEEDSDSSFNILVNNVLKLPRIFINVNNKPINFIIDTGTSVNLISETTYLQNFEESLRPDTSKIFPCCQSEQLEVIGKFTANLNHQNNSIKSEIIVIKGN